MLSSGIILIAVVNTLSTEPIAGPELFDQSITVKKSLAQAIDISLVIGFPAWIVKLRFQGGWGCT